VLALALALAATLAALPDVLGDDPDPQDAGALLEAVLRAEGRPRRAPTPCEERTGWVGDDGPREPAPCDDEDGPWLVAPRPLAEDRED
jgi:hypothetical protein